MITAQVILSTGGSVATSALVEATGDAFATGCPGPVAEVADGEKSLSPRRSCFSCVAALFLAAALGCSDDVAPTDGGSLCRADSDCDDGVFCNGVERCATDIASASANGCNPGTPPCGSESCDEETDSCATGCVDADGDGVDDVACGGNDCDDADPNRYPGNPELCDEAGHDEDCDPATLGSKDQDGDGYVDIVCCNGTTCGADCDDTRVGVSPEATEACNQLDDDCDGDVDEGVSIAGFVDADRDLHGDPDRPLVACADTVGFSSLGDDCDDTNVAVHGAQLEICDGIDNNCRNGADEVLDTATWYVDADGDGFGDPSETIESCDVQMGYSLLPTDCDDDDPDVNPAAAELCNGRDDDCNGLADFAIGPNDFEDDDGDGVVDAACDPAPDLADCADGDVERYPGATESCDGRDNDCDATVDEDCVGGRTCPRGTDQSTSPACDAILCEANQRVVAHECTACSPGFESAAGADASGADTSCSNIDECAMANDCDDICMDTVGDYECACTPPYTLAPDGRACLGEASFDYTGDVQTFVVPEGVSSVDVTVQGGEGGRTSSAGSPPGGQGAVTTATLAVTPGETLYVYVGGRGSPSAAGYNGGGSAGGATITGGGGGGGASDIRRGGMALANRIVVAGGGGGAGHSGDAGGSGGGLQGANGGGGGRAGGGGTEAMGGTGGTADLMGGNGSLGLGGDSPSGFNTGGGGGGGYYGGGAGGTVTAAGLAGGGGGGSSYVLPGATGVTLQRGGRTGRGSVFIRW